MKARMILNDEKHGVELHFEAKPDAQTLALLKNEKNGRWHYHKKDRYWYARQNDTTIAFARRMAEGGDSVPQTTSPQHSPYMPPYDKVKDIGIFASAKDVALWDVREGYFADIPALIKIKHDHVLIINLTNALVPGKVCKRLSVSENYSDVYRNAPITDGLRTFADLYDQFFNARKIPDDCTAYETELPSMRTFTPFKSIKPIKIPAKWTISHVWKAILSGQIYDGKVDGKYTDDYRYDAYTNFSEGRKINLIGFAADLIESPSGWYVHPDKQDGGSVQLSVNCHSFDMRTLYFDEGCTHEEGVRRQNQAASELETHNATMQAKHLATVACDPCTLYEIQFLVMDDNTGRYEEDTALVSGACIDAEERAFRFYPVMRQVEVPIQLDALYQISDFHNRPNGEDDPRLIWLDKWTVYATGLALMEKLKAGYRNGNIGLPQSVEAFSKELTDRISGHVTVMFGNNVDYTEMASRFDREVRRAQEAMAKDA